jgi:hypothetical protein
MVFQGGDNDDLPGRDGLALFSGKEFSGSFHDHPDMVAMVGMRDNLLARLHAEQADLGVIIGPDGFMAAFRIVEFLDLLDIQHL